MRYFVFDLQRFAEVVTIPVGETYKLDGVTYTALTAAQLNLDDDNKISGISSGSVSAVVTGSNNPTVTFDASDGAIDFTIASDGKIITVTKLFPIEFISGNFTYKGNTLTVSAGSTLAIVGQRGVYSLRNENTFVYGGTYTFSNTALTTESQHTISIYTLSNGNDVRTLQLEQFGKVVNNFAERGFTLTKGSSEVLHIGNYALTATAVDKDAGLNIELGEKGLTLIPNQGDGKLNVTLTRGDLEIVSGELECISGNITFGYDNKVTFEKGTSFNFTQGDYVLNVTATDTATTGISLTNAGISFTPGENDGGLNLVLSRGGTVIFGGELNISGGTILFNPATQKFSFTEGTEVQLGIGNEELGIKVVGGDASIKVVADGAGNFTLTPDEGDGSLDITLKQNGATTFYNNVSVSGGSIVIGNFGQTIGLTAGTTVNVTLGNYKITATANDDASFKLGISGDGNISITPQENDGALDVVISRGSTTIFSNTVNVSGGTILFNPATQAITLTDGTKVSMTFGDYELVATAKGNAATVLSLTGNGISVTPNTGDGSLDITLKSSAGSINVNLEVLSGSFILGEGGAITVTKDTELRLDFGGGYVVNLKSTNDAGGSISIGEDGITFKPNSSDGGLELSVTRDGETRTASLDVTGSVTYKLDGSISLAQGTVVKNIFESGNVLTITANTDASGSMIFAPNNGLTIKPSTPDALNVVLTTNGLDVATFTSIDGTINYTGGIITASDGTQAHLTVYDIWETELRTSGGSASIQFTADRTVYTANEGATFVLDYLDGTTLEIQNGSFTDIYATETSEAIELVSEGSNFKSNDGEFVFTLDKAGNYTLNSMNVKTSADNVDVSLADYDTILFATDAPIKISTADDKFFTLTESDGAIQAKISDKFEVSNGTITFDNTTKKISITAGASVSTTRGDKVITFTAPEEISAAFKVEEGISYFGLDGNTTAKVSVTNGGQTTFAADLEMGGVVSYNPATGTFGLTGANSSHGDGTNTFAQLNVNGYEIKMATADTTVVFIPAIVDGKLELNFPNERKHAMAFTLSKDGRTILDNQLIVDGTIGIDTASQEISLTKGTVLTLSGDGKNSLEITALDDASGKLTFTDAGIRFAPNAGDGQLELNFVAADRRANVDISAGALILKNDGTFALEKDTVVNVAWEDGTKLTLSASDTGGSIGFDEQGLKVSSDGELSIDLTTATGVQTTLSNLEGTIHYNAGKVLFDENSTLTATSTLGGKPVNITLESGGEDGYIEISAKGTRYVAGTGALSITWSRDGKSSTFAISNGNIFIGHGIFEIAEGTELSTDLKDLVPALYFTTTDAGTYIINGHTITTSAANMAMTATDDRMTFTPGNVVVGYDEMTFTGDGKVSLTPDGVTLGAGVKATGFGTTSTFILTEKGTVTADGKIFELTEDVPTGISVTGSQDGFIFSRTLTAESEERLGIKDSPDIGKIFTEQFAATEDNYYRVQTDLLGLQQIIGMTSPVTINATADISGESERTVFDIITDNEGVFTLGEKAYTISGDTNVAIKGIFNTTVAPCARGFDSLNGTVSGDFTEHAISLNGGDALIIVHGDDNVALAANENGAEIFNVSDGATLETYSGVSKIHTDGAGRFVFGATNEYDSLTIETDAPATFEFDDREYLTAINNIGINLNIAPDGNISYVSSYNNRLFVHDAQNVTIETAAPESVWVQMTGESMTLNDNDLTLTGDADGIWIRNKEFTGLDEGASLRVSEAGTYTTEVVTLEAEAGDVIVGLDGNDAYIYDENNPLITKKTSTEEIIDIFKPNESYIVGSESRGKFDISLTGGDLAVVENTAARVNITSGDDTVVSQGKYVNVSMTGGNTWLFPTGGKMTLQSYDASTNSGFGTTFNDIASAVESGRINFNNGKLSIGSAQVDMGKRSELVNFFDRAGALQKVGFAEHDTLLDASNETADLLIVGGEHATLMGGSGDDTIYAAEWSFIDAGKGNNLVSLSSDGGKSNIVFNGKTTVEGFHTGFGYGADTVYIPGNPASVEFKSEGLTFYGGNDSLVLSDVTTTAKVNLYHKSRNALNKGVFIAKDDWYEVSNSDLTVKAGEEVYFVGPSTEPNYGVDFSNVTQPLNITLDTAYVDSEDYVPTTMWVNNVHSIKAGAGLTTIVGSDKSDTIFAGTSANSLWGGAGDDLLIGNNSADKKFATEFFYMTGDGRDVIRDFNFGASGDKINLDTTKISAVNMNAAGDVVLELNDADQLILEDAQGKYFKIGNFLAKVDKNISYDDTANCFVATAGNASVSVDTAADIWLDGSHGKFFVGDVRTLDASKSTGANELAGNSLDNTIIAGEGNASLWGGSGGNDLLQGGAGLNNFYYVIGNGSDTISGVNDGDIVNLAVTLEMIASTNITADSVAINFIDGGSLRINGTADITCRLADGSEYSADRANLAWIAKNPS